MLIHDAIKAVCPIDGVSIGSLDDKSTWRIDFAESATDEQKAAALAVLDAFDPIEAAKPTRVYAGDIVDALTDTDYDKVKSAAAGSIALERWWDTLLSRANPIDVSNPRFVKAWQAFTGVVGQDRADEIMTALKEKAF